MGRAYIFPLIIFAIVVATNYYLQRNMLEPRVLNANLRSFTPLVFLAVAQTFVIIGGSIDLSLGAVMSLTAAIMVTNLSPDTGAGAFILVFLLALSVGMLLGAINGLMVTYARLPPFITTYAISFVYAGLALWVLPRPGGDVPRLIAGGYRNLLIVGLPAGIFVFIILLLSWTLLRNTRYGTFLYAIGGNTRSAYVSGVPVLRDRMTSHIIAGALAVFAALFFVLNTGSSDARIGDSLTLDSIVAVVLGGTPLSGGIGGIAGSILGVLILGFVRNIVSFANVNSWYQPLVDASIILVALASPGFIRLIQSQLKKRQ
jgi:ribose transport system permease protein